MADIPCDIVDAVRDNLTIRERGEVVVKGLERSVGQLNLRKFLQFFYTISLIINGLI